MSARPGPGGSIVLGWLSVLLREKLTDSGRLVFWLFLLANAAGTASFIVKVYFVWCALLALLAVSLVASRLARVPLEVDLVSPRQTTAGSELELPLRVRNQTRRAALDLEFRVMAPPGTNRGTRVALDRVDPGEERVVPLPLGFPRRGHYVLDGVEQDTVYPWGLWRDTRRVRAPRSLLVYPSFNPLRNLDIPVGRRYQPGGIALTSHVGDSTEFMSTREFRAGDSLRNIHWRSWGRLGKPVVKEFEEEFFCRIALVVDTFQTRGRGRGPAEQAFEAAVSLAASLVNRLALEEYILDLFAAGPEIYHFQAGRSLAYLENVMDVLACLEPCHEPPFQKIEPVLLEHMGNITTTLAILLDWDEARARTLQALVDRGSELKILLVRAEPPPVAEHPTLGRVHWLAPELLLRGGVEDL